jgi:heterodisulfide reductase subunit B
MKISIFTGCVVPIKYPGIEAAVRRTAPLLGIELVDVKFGCCPSPVGLKSVHFDAWLALAARNLCLTEEKGLDVVTICSGCTNTLRETNHILARDEKKRLFVHDMLRRSGRTYRGDMRIYHLPELFAEEEILERMEGRLVRPLEGLRIGTHYGCHYYRPAGTMGSRDGRGASVVEGSAAGAPPRDEQPKASLPNASPPAAFTLPQDMEIILETLGAEVAEYNRQDLCCGAALSINTGASAESLAIAEEKLRWMREAGLDALAVACPACFTQFDTGQLLLSRRAQGTRTAEDEPSFHETPVVDERRAVPVFHIAELVAYALGMEPGEMDFGRHKVKAPWVGR